LEKSDFRSGSRIDFFESKPSGAKISDKTAIFANGGLIRFSDGFIQI
jgi:hypothetical protein